MKNTGLVLVALAMVLAACASEADKEADSMSGEGMSHEGHHVMQVSEKEAKEKKEAADLLVKRFGIVACEKADLLGTVRRTSPEDGETMLRSFQVPLDCANETLAAVKKAGFIADAKANFAGTAPDGNVEKIKIELPEGVSAGIVEWETNRK